MGAFGARVGRSARSFEQHSTARPQFDAGLRVAPVHQRDGRQAQPSRHDEGIARVRRCGRGAGGAAGGRIAVDLQRHQHRVLAPGIAGDGAVADEDGAGRAAHRRRA